MEVAWLGSHGFISGYADYKNLPYGVLEDCRMVMWAEDEAQRLAAARKPLKRGAR